MKPRISTVIPAGDSVRVVQLTDSHLCAQRGGTLLAMDTDHSLQAVIDLVRSQRGTPDIILGTGDMADGGSSGAYERLGPYFDQLGGHSCFLPGNHDDRVSMAAALGEYPAMASELLSGNWQILMLDSQVPGEVGGTLGAEQLALLQDALLRSASDGLYSLVCLHHHPLPVGCAWLDEQRVSDADELLAILDTHSHVRGVLWGHVHQQVDWQRGGVLLMGSPSTCVQFAPDSERFKADDLPPGYRWLDLRPDGIIDTAVERVEGVAFTVDLEIGGYLEH